jgi:MATE family multidrug resistance protein
MMKHHPTREFIENPLKRYHDYARECRALLAIAWPMLIAQLAQVGMGIVNTVMAGQYHTDDLAAVAVGYNIWLPLFLVVTGVMLGATTIIAQDFGAGRLQRIRDSLPQALWLALSLGLLTGALCFFCDPLLRLLRLEPITGEKCHRYLQAIAFGLPAAAVFQALRCHTQGIGIMRPFAVASVIGFIANMPLSYAFIYGRWGAPELGAAGCGVATAIAMWLSPIVISVYMLRSRTLKPYLPPLRLVAPDIATLREICRLGLPMGLSFFLEVTAFSVIALLIATLGNTAMASHQIAFSVWDATYMLLVSVGSAMATRVGHAIGGGNKPMVSLAIRCGAAIAVLLGLLCMVVLQSMPGLIIAAYTQDAAIHGMAIILIRLAGLFIALDAIQVTTSFALRAFKDTRFPFVVLCSCYWLVTLPLGYWLGLVLAQQPLQGTVGFWKAMVAGIALSGIVLGWRLLNTLRQPLPAPAAG